MPLTRDRNTLHTDAHLVSHPVAGGVKIYAGALIVLNSSGFAAPGSTATTLTAIGRAEHFVDNLLGANGAHQLMVMRGIFLYANLSADLVTRAEIGKSCYVVDDFSVAKTNGSNTRSIAGKVINVVDSGVWVEIG